MCLTVDLDPHFSMALPANEVPMYLLATASVDIECSRETVFDYVANLTHFADWFPGVLEVRPRDQLPLATVGKQYEETVLMPLRGRRSVVIRVAEVDPPRRFVTEGALAILMPRMEVEFLDAGSNACRMQWRMLSRSIAPISRWTILPLARLTMQKRADAAMRRLKMKLEAGNAPALLDVHGAVNQST